MYAIDIQTKHDNSRIFYRKKDEALKAYESIRDEWQSCVNNDEDTVIEITSSSRHYTVHASDIVNVTLTDLAVFNEEMMDSSVMFNNAQMNAQQKIQAIAEKNNSAGKVIIQ